MKPTRLAWVKTALKFSVSQKNSNPFLEVDPPYYRYKRLQKENDELSVSFSIDSGCEGKWGGGHFLQSN